MGQRTWTTLTCERHIGPLALKVSRLETGAWEWRVLHMNKTLQRGEQKNQKEAKLYARRFAESVWRVQEARP